MKNAAQLEKDVLSLPPEDRAHLALAAWESLESDPAFADNPAFDPDGVALARARDEEIESGAVNPLTHKEFLERTGDSKKG